MVELPPLPISQVNDSHAPFYMRLRNRLEWWQKHATPQVVHLVKFGLPANWLSLPAPPLFRRPPHEPEEIQEALRLMDEYLGVRAVHVRLDPPTNLVPWFVIHKPKPRFIANCTHINSHLTPPPYFRLANWSTIFPYLVKGHYALKIDIKHAYFHLALSPELKEYFNFSIGGTVFQCDSACFGLHYLPFYWTQVMKTFSRKWRRLGIVCFIYLDDILILGPSKAYLRKMQPLILQDLIDSGLVVNYIKSLLDPVQRFEALGLEIDLLNGQLLVPNHKRKGYRKEAGKILTSRCLTPRKVAAILGRFRSLLPAMPALRAFTDLLVNFVCLHQRYGWDAYLPVPDALKEQVISVSTILKEWPGRPFLQTPPPTALHLASDSTPWGWGGLDLAAPSRIVQDFWTFNTTHINHKELEAAIHTTMSLSKPNTCVLLDIDNSVAYSYLLKSGGKVGRLNALLRPFLQWLQANKVHLLPRLVPSRDMKADAISRWELDPTEYTLNLQVFNHILFLMRPFCQPHIDMFASPSTTLLPNFCSRWPHHQATLVDALHCNLSGVNHVYAHPPWPLIGQWLHRLRMHPQVVSMTIVPLWASESWWPLLMSLHVGRTPILKIPPREGLYRNVLRGCMPKLRVPLICILLSGGCYRTKVTRRLRFRVI